VKDWEEKQYLIMGDESLLTTPSTRPEAKCYQGHRWATSEAASDKSLSPHGDLVINN
jgi:hypothetical protein